MKVIIMKILLNSQSKKNILKCGQTVFQFNLEFVVESR